MYQQPSLRPPQLPSGGSQPRPVPCYNCGAFEHLVMACPEPTRAVPAGLAAARAAQAAQATKGAQYSERPDGGRPYKRQKIGPVVTRFPAPATGPVVTHYAPPQAQAPQFATGVDQSHYGSSSMQAYQQYPQTHPYAQGAQYGPQPPSNPPYGYMQPGIPGGPQVYGQPNLPTQQPFINPTAPIPSQQYGYQASQHGLYPAGTYPTPPTPQFAYKHPMRDGQQHMRGYSQQNYLAFQGVSPIQGAPPQRYLPYQGSSPNQGVYHQPPAPYQQHESQSHGQFPMNSPSYSTSAYQAGHAQYQQGYHNQRHKSQYSKPPYQPRFGKQNAHIVSTQSPGSSLNEQGYGPPSALTQQPNLMEVRRSSSISGTQHEGEAWSSRPGGLLNIDEEDFAWDQEMAFVEINHKLADEIAHPLPSFHDEEIILPPTLDAQGITSKYVRPHNLEIFIRDIRLSLNWAILKGDPVFKEINDDSPPIPLDELKIWIRQQLRIVNEEGDTWNEQQLKPMTEEGDQRSPVSEKRLSYDCQNNHPTQQLSLTSDVEVDLQSPVKPSLPQNQSTSSKRSETPVLEQATPGTGRSGTPSFETEDDAWAPQPGEGQMSTSPARDPTEALLASLGVTGAPKPVSQKPATFNLTAGSKDEYVQELYALRPSRQDSGYASQRGSYSAADNTTTYYDYGQSYDGNNPPPPPPPPPRHMRRQFDGANDSPPSDDSGRMQAGMVVASGDIHNGFQQCSSPLTPTSAESAINENAFSNDHKKKPAPLRQVDDITPKLKRRQPKVAEAYSRRW